MIEHTDRQTDRQTDRPTDRQTDRAWHAWIMWCDERSIHSTAERGLSASLSGPMARRADCRWLTQPTGLACSPTDFAASRSAHPIAHCPLACLCLLAYACLLLLMAPYNGSSMALSSDRSTVCMDEWRKRLHGAYMGSHGHRGIGPYTHAYEHILRNGSTSHFWAF